MAIFYPRAGRRPDIGSGRSSQIVQGINPTKDAHQQLLTKPSYRALYFKRILYKQKVEVDVRLAYLGSCQCLDFNFFFCPPVDFFFLERVRLWTWCLLFQLIARDGCKRLCPDFLVSPQSFNETPFYQNKESRSRQIGIPKHWNNVYFCNSRGFLFNVNDVCC